MAKVRDDASIEKKWKIADALETRKTNKSAHTYPWSTQSAEDCTGERVGRREGALVGREVGGSTGISQKQLLMPCCWRYGDASHKSGSQMTFPAVGSHCFTQCPPWAWHCISLHSSTSQAHSWLFGDKEKSVSQSPKMQSISFCTLVQLSVHVPFARLVQPLS